MRKFMISFGAAGVFAALMVGVAGASVVVPALPVASYGGLLLSKLSVAVVAVLPYAAGITAFAIGVGMLKRWLGHKTALMDNGSYDSETRYGTVRTYGDGRMEYRGDHDHYLHDEGTWAP
jgi:hypothetical protein